MKTRGLKRVAVEIVPWLVFMLIALGLPKAG